MSQYLTRRAIASAGFGAFFVYLKERTPYPTELSVYFLNGDRWDRFNELETPVLNPTYIYAIPAYNFHITSYLTGNPIGCCSAYKRYPRFLKSFAIPPFKRVTETPDAEMLQMYLYARIPWS